MNKSMKKVNLRYIIDSFIFRLKTFVFISLESKYKILLRQVVFNVIKALLFCTSKIYIVY